MEIPTDKKKENFVQPPLAFWSHFASTEVPSALLQSL